MNPQQLSIVVLLVFVSSIPKTSLFCQEGTKTLPEILVHKGRLLDLEISKREETVTEWQRHYCVLADQVLSNRINEVFEYTSHSDPMRQGDFLRHKLHSLVRTKPCKLLALSLNRV